MVLSQAIKIITEFIETGQWDLSRFNGYGGMPSSHTAFVVALATEVWQKDGWQSTGFALAIALTLIVVRDAVGFRRYLGRHSYVINQLVDKLGETNFKELQKKELKETLGHTPLEALIGGLIGAGVSLLFHVLFL